MAPIGASASWQIRKYCETFDAGMEEGSVQVRVGMVGGWTSPVYLTLKVLFVGPQSGDVMVRVGGIEVKVWERVKRSLSKPFRELVSQERVRSTYSMDDIGIY